MRNRLALPSSVIMVFAFVISAQAQATEPTKNEIEIRATYSVPSGETNFSGTTASGNTVDFGRDFDFKNEFGWQARYTYRSTDGKHKLVADYDATNWERSTTLTRTITFRGQTYVANASLDGALKLQTFRGMYAYRWGNEKLRFGPMVDMGFIKTSLALNGTTASGTRSSDGSLTKFAATIGYDLDYAPTPKINLFHNLGAIKFRRDNLFHAEGGIKVFVTDSFGAVGGYKVQRYKLDGDDPNFLTIRSHGPFFGGVVRF